MHLHFNFMLQIRNKKISKGKCKGRIIEDLTYLTFYDLNTSSVVGEWVSYLQSMAYCMMHHKREPISYSTAVNYMITFKVALIDKFHMVSVPTQFKTDIWSRMLAKIRQHNFNIHRQMQRVHLVQIQWQQRRTRVDLLLLLSGKFHYTIPYL